MNKFNILVEELLTEIAANVSGGDGVFGVAASGLGGGKFGVQDDSAYAPGDARVPSILGAKKKKKKNRIQRRRFSGL